MLRPAFYSLLALSFALSTSCSRAETAPQASEAKDAPATVAQSAEAHKPEPRPTSEPSQEQAAPTESTRAAEAEAKPPAEDAQNQTPELQPTERTTQKTSDESTAEDPPAETSAQASDPKKPATKEEILNSPQWRRAMFEFSEWLSAQPIYTPQQVAQIKDQFNHRVAAMDAKELAYMLADMEAKFHVMNTPQAKEARAWMAQYLSVMSDRKRAEVLKDVPNIATMTAAQLNAEIQKIIEKRKTMNAEQEAFQVGQAQQVANQLQTDRTNQQNYVRDWNTGPVAYSPYRSQSNVNKRLNDTPTGSGMGFYVSPLGGVGMTFAPSSW